MYLEFTNFDDGMYINEDDIDDELTTDNIEILAATNEAWTVARKNRTETNEVTDDIWVTSHYQV